MSFKSLGLQVHLLSRQWRFLLDKQLACNSLTQASGIALVYIADNQGVSQTELARLLGVETPSLVPVLDQLEQQGLIERRASVQDRRQKALFLLNAATEIVSEIDRKRRALQQELLAGLTAEQQQALPLLLDAVLQQATRLLQDHKEGSQS